MVEKTLKPTNDWLTWVEPRASSLLDNGKDIFKDHWTIKNINTEGRKLEVHELILKKTIEVKKKYFSRSEDIIAENIM